MFIAQECITKVVTNVKVHRLPDWCTYRYNRNGGCECQKMCRWRSCQGRHHVSRVRSLSCSFSREFDDNAAYTVRYQASRRPAVCHCSVPSRFVPRHAVLEHLREFSAIQRREISCVFAGDQTQSHRRRSSKVSFSLQRAVSATKNAK